VSVPDLPSHHFKLMASLSFVAFPSTVIAFNVGIPMGGAQASPGPSATWQTNHPRRWQVNQRIRRQDQQISRERRQGELTGAQPHSPFLLEPGLRSKEQADEAVHLGHITRKAQQ